MGNGGVRDSLWLQPPVVCKDDFSCSVGLTQNLARLGGLPQDQLILDLHLTMLTVEEESTVCLRETSEAEVP